MKDLSPLFDPAGIVVAGVSSHPGKFGSATLHNILACGYRGRVFATNPKRGTVLGVDCLASVADVPSGAADLAFVCVPAPTVAAVLRDAATVGIRAAFIASAGFGEGGHDPQLAVELTAIAHELDIVIGGPNGQGLVSTPSSLCAQFVGPFPPAGRISVVSQSGNLGSGIMNLAASAGVGIARAVSAGNATCLDVADYVEWLAGDPATDAIIVYVEGVASPRRFHDVVAAATAVKPVVVVKGGASAEGAAAAASHTGALASDDRIFDGLLRQAGAWRESTIGLAVTTAAALATHGPLRGGRVAVLTAAGGWGVLASDCIARSGLDLAALTPELCASIDELLPSRWSRSNPIDVAGGETRDTIPALLELLGGSDEIDAVLLLGLGIQANTAKLMRHGPFAERDDIERIASFHRRQDERYATAAIEVSRHTGTPVLAVTELATADPENPGPATLRAGGHPCFADVADAVRALEALASRGRSLAGR